MTSLLPPVLRDQATVARPALGKWRVAAARRWACWTNAAVQRDFLMPGMGGYSGGRFLKKIVTNVQAQRSRK
jgi:hypothetical protein